MGFGRAPGADPFTSAVLNDEKGKSLPYPRKVADLLGFVTGNHGAGSEYEGMFAHPRTPIHPQPFVLGASGSTAKIAAQAGLGFTFAHFINPRGDGPAAAKAYRAAFRATDFSKKPTVITAVFVAIGETEAQAEEFAEAFHLWLAYAESAKPFDRVPSLATTRAHNWAPEELEVRKLNQRRLISGTANQVATQLRKLADDYGTEEVMINLMVPGEAARLKAIDLLCADMQFEMLNGLDDKREEKTAGVHS